MTSGKGRILCVDGDEDTCFVESALFHAAGYEVETANAVAGAMEFALRGGFDLYLVAYRQRDGTGLELCRELREFDAATPILFFSAWVYESDRRDALEAGATAFLRKPDDIILLVETGAALIGASQESATPLSTASGACAQPTLYRS